MRSIAKELVPVSHDYGRASSGRVQDPDYVYVKNLARQLETDGRTIPRSL